MKVLVVDDLAESRLMLRDLLESRGHAVLTSEDGLTALEIARGQGPDMIVSDVLMPGMDGFELCRRIKEDPRLRRAAFVFYTAHFIEPDDERLALDTGASLFIRKPAEPDAFMACVDAVMAQQRSGGLPVPPGPVRPADELRSRHDERLATVLLKKMRDLESTKRTLANLIGNLPGMVYRCRYDVDWTMDFVSDRSLDLTGYPPEALVGSRAMRYGDLIHPDDRERIRHEVQDARVDHQPFELDYRIVHRDGRVRRVWEQGRWTGSDPAPEVLEGYIIDVTDQRQAETERNRFFELSLDLLCVAGTDGYFKQLNPAWSRVLGWSEAELLARPWIDIVHPEDRDSTEQARVELTVGEQIFSFENRFRHRDGSYRWLSWNSMPLADEGLMYGVARDVTGQKATEIQLKRLNRALRTLSEGNRVLIHVTDEAELLREMCRIAVEEGGYRMAWVGYREDDEARSIKTMAAYGDDSTYLDDLHLTWADGTLGRGPAGRCIREGATQIVQDIPAEPAMAPWHREAARRGYSSVIALPLPGKDRTMGLLVIYGGETNAFVPDEVSLLEELANDLAYGIANHRKQAEIMEAEKRRQEALLQAIQAIAMTVEKRDPYTAGHQNRVAQLVTAIAGEMGLSQGQIEGIRLGAMIHDIGKIYVPAEILNRPGRLSTNEFGIIKTHPEVGYEIVKDVHFPWPIAQMILQHHERLDGSGYPQGLTGDAILLEAQIMAVADVVEAMSTHRPYRPALGIEAAIAEIERKKGAWFNTEAVEACVRVLRGDRFSLDAAPPGDAGRPAGFRSRQG